MRPVFADPKTDFVFKRIFGSEIHKPLLIELLNALLELSGDHRIADLQYLSPEQCLLLPRGGDPRGGAAGPVASAIP